ncbi:MAG TPA: fumarylacetoacetate hydrolase family protein [Candidatus Dormibacteraeota bacterium]|nr:fumarylacetoacetate hydrolase family protein [Candidatus Dormibacteraeota bacterium]
MRLVSYWAGSSLEAGFEEGGRVLSTAALGVRSGGATTVRTLLAQGVDLQEMTELAGRLMADDGLLAGRVGELRLGPPIPDPDKIICLGQNYADHVAEMANTRPDVPNLFPKFRNCLIGTGDAIRLPRSSQQVDYEGELAVVIGRRCHQVAEKDALAHVGGYTVMNDVSARDLQFRTGQYTVGKAADTFCPMGPGLVPAFEIPDPQVLELATYLNGEQMQLGNTAAMLFSVAEAISFISEVITLEPGDVIATGTPSGVGYKRVPPRFLLPGDLIEVEVERIGRLSNSVVQG